MRNYHRRSRNEWIDLVSQQSLSSLSASQFCQQQEITYSSFMNWKKKLSGTAPKTHSATDHTGASFIEITPETSPDTLTGLDSDHPLSALSVTLDLGQGVQLHLHRG